jgi:hypothetical protein
LNIALLLGAIACIATACHDQRVVAPTHRAPPATKLPAKLDAKFPEITAAERARALEKLQSVFFAVNSTAVLARL